MEADRGCAVPTRILWPGRRNGGSSIRDVKEKTARSELQSCHERRSTQRARMPQSFRGVTGNAIAMGLINDPETPRVLQNAP